jgi:hypothetical protein
MIKKLLSLSVLSLTIGLGAGCGSSDSSSMSEMEACKQYNAVYCDKFFNCLSAELLTLIKDTVGLNAADCKTKSTAEYCTTDEVKCPLGETFHGDKAAECVSQLKGLSCSDITTAMSTGEDPTEPAACSLICTK